MEKALVEVEELEPIDEEVMDMDVSAEAESGSGAFVAGLAGGMIAFAVISVGKKLAGVAAEKAVAWRAKRKAKKSDIIDTEVVDNEEPSDEEDSDK